MWPFKNKNNEKTKILMIPRYTYEAWTYCFPEKGLKEWEACTFPNDTAAFIRLFLSKEVSLRNNQLDSIIIATLDAHYVDWLKSNKKKHKWKSMTQYIRSHKEDMDFWNQRLLESEMTNTYNVLGIQNLMFINPIQGSTSELFLPKDVAEELTKIIQEVYDSETVFCPGWLVKGCDLASCAHDLLKLAKIFWANGSRVRLGKYLEQKYSNEEKNDQFLPLYFSIPFIIKTNIHNAKIDLNGMGIEKNSVQAMANVQWSEYHRAQTLNLIKSELPHIISVGPSAVTPGAAFLAYQMRAARNKVVNLSRY